ncbi:MAG: FtsX-like permease family protein, partial [Bacteroidota bacterium]
GVDHKVLEEKIPEWVSGYLDWSQEDLERLKEGEARFALQPISDIHLQSHLRWELEDNGNILYVYILVAILGFLILIASINYVNLTTAKSVERAKEVGVRKTIGAVSRGLSGQFYLESILFSLVALVLSIGVAALLLNGFNGLSGKQFEINELLSLPFLSKAVLVGLTIGVLAGSYPAIVLSSFQPTEVLKGKLATSSRGVRLRSFLVILQFTISAILISGSFIIFSQIRFMKEKDLGFDQEALISLNVPISIEIGGVDVEALRNTQTQLETITGVRATALVSSIPGGQFNQHAFFLREDPENKVDASEIMVDYNIEDVFGIELASGRMFDRSYAEDSLTNIIINEEMASQLIVENPVGMTIVQNASGREFEFKIIGVVKDFHFQSLHQQIQPLIMTVQPLGAGHILVKLDGQHFGKTISQIEEIYDATVESELPFEYHFLDQDLAAMYQQEERTLSIFSVFSAIALILAALGLLGMAIAILNQRVKEVGMRKILGASSAQIMQMILGQFARLIIIAMLIGLPVSYVVMQGWINEFSYQAPFGLMPYILAFVVLLVVAMVSVISAVTKITYSNPVDSLRCE